MKFRFCGDADCPDWLLMQINTLSALSVDHFEEICLAVAESLQGNDLDYGRMNELGKEAKLDMTDLKACLSGLSFTLRSGTKYGVPSHELGAELEQLGLEPEHAARLVSIYSKCYSGLRQAALKSVLRRPAPEDLSATLTPAGLKVSFRLAEWPGNPSNRLAINMTKLQANLLLQELKTVADRMDKISGK
ncbi:COMM domain-containing protein 4 [Cimex lectularius]|uniref:COMM domain-containing protein n=1 Tax=Cimex lectularius TaxID=79782 RepID=A0A8I6R8B7_CIMLE|nr:COMM domain-containing protein 4 [Cimex lectularius]XP_014241121.1 COMM domain-containing protein 4 [Cimex lectularius]